MGDAIRRAYRNLRSAPMFWLTATLSLSIGIGGNLAMFTVINPVILRPLPFPESARLVLITQAHKYSTPYNTIPLPGCLRLSSFTGATGTSAFPPSQ